MKKILTSVLAIAMLASLASCGNNAATNDNGSTSTDSADTNTSTNAGTTISILNTKSEIQTQWEDFASDYEAATGVKLEVSVTVGDSPSEDITKRYASGEVPTLFMGDAQDVIMLDEYALDLSNEEWASVGGTEYGITQNDRLISFPFCVEARGLMYNKTIIESTTGEEFNPDAITNMDDLKAVLDNLVAGGMDTPAALNQEDWSLGAHYLGIAYEEQPGADLEATFAFVDELKAGTVDLNANARFTSLMDTFDLLMEYNMNKADPLAADYNLNAVSLAEGDIAFWFNGNWAWAEMSDYADENSEYGIMPLPQNDTADDVNKKLAGGGSKQVMIDTKYNSEEQQAAALELLNYLVYDEAGQSFLVNDCNLVPSFSNIELAVTNPLGQSVQAYTAAGMLAPGLPEYPGDHWKEMGAEMQKYLGGQTTREELASNIETYWTNQK